MAMLLGTGIESISDLLSLDAADIRSLDLAHVNLLCAEGLPGAEDLDIDACLGRLDAWSQRAGRMTESHLHVFHQNPALFDHSEPIWRMLAMCRFLKSDCGVSYNMSRAFAEPDWTDSRDLFLHGLLGPERHGTCVSLPVLLVAMSRRMEYPVSLSHAPGHIFSRWDATDHDKPNFRGRFNIEFSGDMDVFPDEHYFDFPVSWTPSMREQYRADDESFEYLYTFSRAQEVAHCLSQRAVCMEAVGRLSEAINTFFAAHRLDGRYRGNLSFARRALRTRAETVMRSMGFEPEALRGWLVQQGLLPASALTGPAIPSAIPGNPPTNLPDIAHAVLAQTCAGTPAKSELDLLCPNPPEPKVDPYASMRDPDGQVRLDPNG